MKNLIFLDIDGVLVSFKELHSGKLNNFDSIFRYGFSKKCVKIFNKIVKDFNADVVLSSSWKMFWKYDVVSYIKKQGVNAKILDKTPNDKGGERGKEINRWIENNDVCDEYDSIIVIDDDINDITKYLDYENLIVIHTSGKTGLVEKNYKQIKKFVEEQNACND